MFALQKRADAQLKNRDGQSPLDLAIQLGDDDLIDILKGDLALLDACKKGNLVRVKKILTSANRNYQDPHGRHSSALHLAAGYNHLEIAEFLLSNNVDVEMRDKGGLIPLHNAASYGVSTTNNLYPQNKLRKILILKSIFNRFQHVDMAAMLIRHKPDIINIADKWGYTALHE